MIDSQIITEYRKHRADGVPACLALHWARTKPPAILATLDKWANEQIIELDQFGLTGYTAKVRIERDDDAGRPWDNMDMLATPTWRRGNFPAFSDTREMARIHCGRDWLEYDRASAYKRAHEEGCGYHKGMARHDAWLAAVRVVESEIDYIRRWCGDEWHYIGFQVDLLGRNGYAVGYDSCWGFDDAGYCLEQAAESLQRLIDTEITSRRKQAESIRESRRTQRQRILDALDGFYSDLGADLCPT